MAIRVPGRRPATARLWSPAALMVTRRYGGWGSADSE